MFYVCLDCGQITERTKNQIKIMHPLRDSNKIDWDRLKTLKRKRGQRGCKCAGRNQNQDCCRVKIRKRVIYQDYFRYVLWGNVDLSVY